MRHAIYFTPDPTSDLNRLGSAWLGRDALTCQALPQPDPRLRNLTASAHRYGLHATLKSPFRLKENTQAAFDVAVTRLASQHESFMAPALALERVDGFLALVPETASTALDHLAADCVQKLDDFRTPPDEAELRRRRAAGLTEHQDQLLRRWGYPYVLEEFRFHITLTERLTHEQCAWIRPIAEEHFAPVLGREFKVDALSLMLEPDDGADFRIVERFPLVRSAMEAA